MVWYVLESYIERYEKHKPRYRVMSDMNLAREKVLPRGERLQRTENGRRLEWRILQGESWPTEEEAHAFLNAHRGLRSLETPHLFTPRLAPAIFLECGCVVSDDKRRVKQCEEAKARFIHAKPFFSSIAIQSDDKWRELMAAKDYYDRHFGDARLRLRDLVYEMK